jgi:hypothetical protein
MSNRRRITVGTDGCVSVRVTVEPQLWELSGQLAKQWHVDQITALSIMLEKITRLIEAGKAEFLGPEFSYAFNKLVMTDKLSVGGLPPVESTKLHRSLKTKSGFVGVYANGQGFRAMGKIRGADGDIQKSIGTFPTAEQAAWARFIHYKKLGLPYGAVEEALAEARRTFENEGSAQWSDEKVAEEWNKSMTTSLPIVLDGSKAKAADLMPFGFDKPIDEIDRDV